MNTNLKGFFNTHIKVCFVDLDMSKYLKILLFLLVFAGCEGPEGPTGPTGPEGPAGEVRELIVTVANKMYTTGNSFWATIYYDDSDADENTTVIYTGFKNLNGVWVNVEVYDSYYCCNIYATGSDFGYDGKSGYAALIYDPDYDLVGTEIKLLYIP